MLKGLKVAIAVMAFVMAFVGSQAQITIEPENRCSPYDRGDYHYPASIEAKIVNQNLGGLVFSPYTGEVFRSIRETDIEHIVAAAEAHDSGLCSVDEETRGDFAQDLDNLTLASPSVNRHQKSDKDLADWLPDESVCWYVSTVIQVKAKYGLSMDVDEAETALNVLAECYVQEMIDG